MQAFLHNTINLYDFIQQFICMLFRHLISRTRFVFTTFVLTTVYCLLTTSSNAQVYPVLVNTTMRGPYSLSLTDYATPAYDRIQANLYLADLTKNNYPVKVRLVIRSVTGITIATSPGNEVGPILLDGGVNHTLQGSDVYSLFDANRLTFSGISYNQYRANGLPEGNYQFHFEVVDAQFGVVISNINVGYANAWLILNDPPIINKPANGVTVTPTLPQNIFFQWTPRHTGSPNSAFTTEYDVQLVEIYPVGANPNDVMLSAPIIFEKTTFATAYNYSIADPNLIEGKWYAFRVRAHDQNGLDLFKNQGYSEVFSFYYGQPCPQVTNLNVISIDNTSSLVTFSGNDAHQSYTLEYKQKNKNWSSSKTVTSTESRILMTDLLPGQAYDIRLQSFCNNNTSEYDTLTFVSGGVRTSCTPPAAYSTRRKQAKDATSPVVLDWAAVSGAAGYSVTIRTPSGSVTKTTRTNTIEIPSYVNTVSGLEESIPDQFEVAIGIQCTDGSSSEGTFKAIDLSSGAVNTVNCTPPVETAITAVQIDPYSVKVSWPAVPGFDQYRFRYRLKGSEKLFLEVLTSENSVVLSDLDKDNMYEFQIQYHCQNNSWMSGNSNVFSIIYDPSIFAVQNTGSCYPPSGLRAQVRTEDIADIAWDKDSEAKTYQFFWRPVAAYGALPEPWQNKMITATTLALKGLYVKTEYECFIRSQCKDGLFSISSDTLHFNTGNVNSFSGTCTTPRLLPPDVQSDVEALIDWDTRVEYTKFHIQYRTKTATDWVELEDTLIGKYLQNLSFNTTYVYRVMAYCGTTTSDYSPIDTFVTFPQGVNKNTFRCGGTSMDQLLTDSQPIESFKVGDKFKAADFELEVAELTSERPYNGLAVVKIPYLEYSQFEFQMENVWVNQDSRMYSGRVIMKGMVIRIIDPALGDMIAGFLEKLEDGLDNLSNNLAKADSIQDALNEAVGALVQPIDWDQYDGWTAQQFLDTSKAMMQQAQALIANGSPQSITEGKLLMIKAIELIRMAAVIGNETYKGLSEMAKKLQLRLKEILEHMQTETTASLDETQALLDQLTPPLNQKYATFEDASAAQLQINPSDFVIGDLDTNGVVPLAADSTALATSSRFGSVYTDAVAYRTKENLKKSLTTLIEYIKLYSRDANTVKLAKKMEKDLADVIDGRDLNQLTQEELNQLEVVVEDYLKKFFEEESIEDSQKKKTSTSSSSSAKKANKKAKK